MLKEGIAICPIIHFKQIFPTGCGPTSMAMVFSGFETGTKRPSITERELVRDYFSTARLDVGANNAGVANWRAVEGLTEIIRDHGLARVLRTDVLDPKLGQYINSGQKKHIVQVPIEVLANQVVRFEGRFTEEVLARQFYQTLAKLSEAGVGVYTFNVRMLESNQGRPLKPEELMNIGKGFYMELIDFIRQGHSVAPKGEALPHMRAIDGVRTTDEEICVFDPNGKNYMVHPLSFMPVTEKGVRGRLVDCLFRVSPR